MEIVDLPDPHPGPRQVRIVVHAAGVGATDPKLRGHVEVRCGVPADDRPRRSLEWSTRSAKA